MNGVNILRAFRKTIITSTRVHNRYVGGAAMCSDKGMTVYLDLKDFPKESIKLDIEGGHLIIDVSKTNEVIEGKNKFKRFKQIYRSYKLLENSDLYNIEAIVENKQLKVFVPLVKPKIRWLDVTEEEDKEIK